MTERERVDFSGIVFFPTVGRECLDPVVQWREWMVSSFINYSGTRGGAIFGERRRETPSAPVGGWRLTALPGVLCFQVWPTRTPLQKNASGEANPHQLWPLVRPQHQSGSPPRPGPRPQLQPQLQPHLQPRLRPLLSAPAHRSHLGLPPWPKLCLKPTGKMKSRTGSGFLATVMPL